MADIKISQMQPWVGAVTGNAEFPVVFGNENYRVALSQLSISTFGFGSMAMQNSNSVSITGGNVAVSALSGAITIANGGTGLSSAPGAGQILIGTGSAYALSTLTAGSGIAISNAAGAITISATGAGAGTVTSVGVDGGSTGLTFSNSPITTSGTMTMSGTLGVANGGTGATSASAARASLGAAKSGANSDITSISGLTTPLSVAQGGTGANDSLSGYIFGNGLNPFTSVATIPMSDLTGTLPVAKGGTGATNPANARVNLLPSYGGNAKKVLALNSGATDVEWVPVGIGSVTSVDVSGGTTGLTTSGGPIVSAGTITLAGTLVPANGGTGYNSYVNGQLLIGKNDGTLGKSTLTAGTGISVTNGNGSITLTNSAPDQVVSIASGTGISVSGTYPTFTVTNTAPDQVITLTGGTGVSITGTYPNFTISAPDVGTVTSVNASGGTTGLTFTGGPITSSGTLTLSGTLSSTNGGTGNSSYSNGQLLIGKTDGTLAKATLTAGTGVSVTNGDGSVTVTNTAPDQIVSLTGAGTTSVTGTYPNFTITSNDQFVGTVTSVNASGGTTGLTFSGGPVTSTGTLTLGGTLAVANGGTGATTAGNARTNLGAAASGANTDITSIALTSGTISATPNAANDIANKAYVDSLSAGINFHQAVRLASTAALPAYTYNNGSSGVGATITANANGALSLDGVAVAATNRVLIKNETSTAAAYNGVYVVTQAGGVSSPFILTRASDYNTAGSGVNQIDAGDFFLVTAGNTLANTSWVQQTPLPITIGSTAITFTQFAAPITYSAGTGLTLTGTVFSITNTGVSANTYGSASSVPVLAINAQGQITSASNSSIAIAGSQITSGSVAIAQGGTGATTAGAARTNLGSTTVGDALFTAASASAARTTLGATTVGGNLFTLTDPSAISFLRINADNSVSALDAATFRTAIGAGVGTVTSVNASGGTTGLTFSGGPVTSTGTLTLAGTLALANGGTGATTAAGALTNLGAAASGAVTASGLTMATARILGRTTASTGAIEEVSIGSGLSLSGGVLSATAAGGTVTSVDASGGTTGLTFSGGPVTTTGTLTLAGTLAVTNGGTGATTASAARTNLGASTVGSNFFTLTNPSAITFPRINADNTVSALDAASFRTATGSGTVTSVSGTGTVNGITLTGTVTSSGSLVLGGTLSGVSLTTQVSGTLPVANGGTNGTATPTAGAVAYGTGTAYAFTSAGTAGQVLVSNGASAPSFGGIDGGTF